MACSAESDEGFCGAKEMDGAWDCKAENVCRTCSTFSSSGGKCVEIDKYPNATVTEFGDVSGADAMAKEIMTRGPIACGVDAGPLLNYTGGVISDAGQGVDHIVSVIGWGKDSKSGKSYWQMRNSWGEFWGEMGYAKVEKGNNALKLEGGCNWAVPGTWTEMATGGNTPCYEGGDNCNEHLPPPPPMNCEKYCTKKSIAMCAQFGMHCSCGDKLYNTTGKGMQHGTSCSGHPGCGGLCNTTTLMHGDVFVPDDTLVLPGFV